MPGFGSWISFFVARFVFLRAWIYFKSPDLFFLGPWIFPGAWMQVRAGAWLLRRLLVGHPSVAVAVVDGHADAFLRVTHAVAAHVVRALHPRAALVVPGRLARGGLE